MAISQYHQKYFSQSDDELGNRIYEKQVELEEIFKCKPLGTISTVVDVAVLGCGDKRFVAGHKEIFSKTLAKDVRITTFDVTIEHLVGEESVFEHDCTLPLPNGPYDVTYAHVLLRFIDTEKQWDLIFNSYEALKPGGMALHIMDSEDYETSGELLDNGYYAVPLERWKTKLTSLEITYDEVALKFGKALILTKTK